MKKLSLIGIALLMICVMSACEAEEVLTEQVLHGLLGADVDLSEDTISLMTEAGESFVIGTTWPEELNDTIPKCENGAVEAATVWNGKGFLTLSQLTVEQFAAYITQFEKMGFSMTEKDHTALIHRYEAVKDDLTVSLSHYTEDEKLVISVTYREEEVPSKTEE